MAVKQTANMKRMTINFDRKTHLKRVCYYLQDQETNCLTRIVIVNVNLQQKSVNVFYSDLDVTIYKSFANANPACQIFYRIALSCFFGATGVARDDKEESAGLLRNCECVFYPC